LDLFMEVSGNIKEAASSEKRLIKSLPEYLLEVCHSMGDLARTRTGALIVIERKDSLVGQISGGLAFDAEIKQEILVALFSKLSPVHDGAVVISDGRIRKVKGILPLKTDSVLPMGTGTRHRSAIGITEKSDAIALVVSEERGELSVAYRGNLIRAKSGKDFLKLVQAAYKGKELIEVEENVGV